MIFVFGSNLSGIHSAGAAKFAHKHEGAVMGEGEGQFGNSYALPTKGINISFMSLEDVTKHINKFLDYAKMHSYLGFKVTTVGCGLAGFHDSEIAPLFKDAPSNCYFDLKWKKYLGHEREYWGTY